MIYGIQRSCDRFNCRLFRAFMLIFSIHQSTMYAQQLHRRRTASIYKEKSSVIGDYDVYYTRGQSGRFGQKV